MEQYYEYCLAAAIVLIPLTSISHFIPPLPYCLLADLCNHTWIPECAQEWDYDYRMFIDDCDLYEYNCDYARNYTITNYSDCFGVASCPPIPTCAACPTCKQCKARRMFDPVATVPLNQKRIKLRHDHGGHEGHQHFVEHIHLVGGHRGVGTLPQTFYGTARKPDRTRGFGGPNIRRYHLLPGRKLTKKTKKKKKKTKKKTTKRTTTKPSKKKPKMKTKTTTQFIETATMTPEFKTKKYTVMKNGKKYIKVIKYVMHRVPKTTPGKTNATEIKDSDFLEK